MARRRYLDDDTYGIMTYGNPIRTTTGGIPRIVAGFNPDGTVRTAISRTSDQEDAELYGPEVTITPANGVFTEGFNGRIDYPSASAYYQNRAGEPGLENPDIDPLTLGLGFGRAAANGAFKAVPKVLERGLHYMNPSAYTGAGAYSTPMGGEGTNLLGAVLDNALFSGMAAAAGNEFINNPNFETGLNAGLNAIPFVAAGLPFIARRARSAQELTSALNRETHMSKADVAAQRATQVRALESNGMPREEAINQVYGEVGNTSVFPGNLSQEERRAAINELMNNGVSYSDAAERVYGPYHDALRESGIDSRYVHDYDAAMNIVNDAEIEGRINELADDIYDMPFGGVDPLYDDAFTTYVNRRRHGLSPEEAAADARQTSDMYNRNINSQLRYAGVRDDAFVSEMERMYQNKFPNDAPGAPGNPILSENNIDWTDETLANVTESADNYVNRRRFVNRTADEQRQILDEYGNRSFDEETELDDFLNRNALDYDDLYQISERSSAHNVGSQQAPEPVSPYTGMTRAEEEALDAENDEIIRQARNEDALYDDSPIDTAFERRTNNYTNNFEDFDWGAYEVANPTTNSSDEVLNEVTGDPQRLVDEYEQLLLRPHNSVEDLSAAIDNFAQENNLSERDLRRLGNAIGNRVGNENILSTPQNVTPNLQKLDINSTEQSTRELTDNIIDDYLSILEENRHKTGSDKKRNAKLREDIVAKYNLDEQDDTTNSILGAIERQINNKTNAERDIYKTEQGKEYVIDGKHYTGDGAGLVGEDGRYIPSDEARKLLKKGGYKSTPTDSGSIIRYGGNSMTYSVDDNGTVDIAHALFTNPEGEPNTLMDFADNKLKTGDLISIASRNGDLSLDSNRLLGLHLTRKIRNSIPKVSTNGTVSEQLHKGYAIEPTDGKVALNDMARKKYKGILVPMTQGDKEKALNDIKRIYKRLEDAHNERNPNNPIHFDDSDFVITDWGSVYVPGYRARHLKFGGLVRGRNNRRTMACYGKRY